MKETYKLVLSQLDTLKMLKVSSQFSHINMYVNDDFEILWKNDSLKTKVYSCSSIRGIYVKGE
jgi:hypothetical protein